MNVHKRCQKNVANNCGINPRQIALLLQQIGISDSNAATTSTVLNQFPGTIKSSKLVFIYFLIQN
jgi:novel protein kinase C epsilon type